jgi:KDO2-lipid IV(A) lauroyltransferase
LIAFWLRIRRIVTIDNLQRAFPELSPKETDRIARGAYKSLGKVFGEFLYLRLASSEAILEGMKLRNPEALAEAAKQNRGLLLVSAHLCNWEWMAMAMSLKMGTPLHVVIKNQTGKYAEQFLNRMRTRFGNQMINAGDVRGIYRVLQNREWIAILGDQAAPPSSVRVSFFGRSVPTFEGPARLALRTRAPLFFVDCENDDDGKYVMTAIEISYNDLLDSSDESVRELTMRHVSVLETAIRKDPARWLWQHRRWKSADA